MDYRGAGRIPRPVRRLLLLTQELSRTLNKGNGRANPLVTGGLEMATKEATSKGNRKEDLDGGKPGEAYIMGNNEETVNKSKCFLRSQVG